MDKKIIWVSFNGRENSYICESDEDLAEQIEACKAMGLPYRVED